MHEAFLRAGWQHFNSNKDRVQANDEAPACFPLVHPVRMESDYDDAGDILQGRPDPVRPTDVPLGAVYR